VLVACCVGARADVLTVDQPVSIQLSPLGKLAVPGAIALVRSGVAFDPFTGALPVSFRVRTSPAGGGTISLQVTSDFVPAGGPSVRAGSLTYVCGQAELGTACSGVQTASVGIQTPVLTLPPSACTGGGGQCSTADPNLLEIELALDNDPSFQTGTYSAQVMLIISAL
jgi:hypothetical protein